MALHIFVVGFQKVVKHLAVHGTGIHRMLFEAKRFEYFGEFVAVNLVAVQKQQQAGFQETPNASWVRLMRSITAAPTTVLHGSASLSGLH
jgi:ribosome maturation factor RimP